MTVTESPQRTLWDGVVLVRERPSAEEAFAAFRRSNPWFMRRFAQLALADRTIGRTRGSAKRYFELLRDEVAERGQRYRLNNDFTALAARIAMEDYPELEGFFETRARKS